MADTYKVKSDYTVLRRKARQSSKGDIYENNLMTITPFEAIMPEGQNIVYSDSNFKFSVRTDTNLKKRHSKSDWVRNSSGETEWTLEDVLEAPISEESEVRIKPDYSSLRDFAYYGSAEEMIHATVNHVLMYFPGELYFSNDKFQPTNQQGVRINIGDYYIVYNECEINVETDFIDETTVENPYRYLCLTLQDYVLMQNGEVISSTLTRDNFVRNPDFCNEGFLGHVNVGGIKIYVYVMAGQKYYLTQGSSNAGKSIRPIKDVVTRYFATIDDFESVLLNRDSNPIYKAVFETVKEKDYGYFYTMESYIWPSINNWTPDMHSSAYQSYIMRLISLAQYHDEFDSNNIWRMMTHEAIKNLDWTFFRENGGEVEDLSNIDSSRINAIVQLYGRQFDGLKRYIDNIKHINKITYDQKNNVPDYHLTDAVENAGFDAILPILTAKTSVDVGTQLFSGLTKIYNEVDVNTNFMRNLKLNSSYLNSVKGTREGVAAMLSLLGFCPNEYEISEYVTVATGNSEYCKMDSEEIFGISEEDAERCTGCSYPSAIDVEMINQNKDSFPVNEFVSSYQGIACKPITVTDESGNTKYRYVVPWFENGKYYDGEWYFQCDGGWGKQLELDVSGMTILDKQIGISVLSGDSIFEETQSRLKFAENLDEMLDIYPGNLEDGDICYVTDISNLLTIQDGVYSGITEETLSHYFIIIDKTKYCILAGNGWNYIPLSDITSSSPSETAQKVIYLETIKDNTIGNNPHIAKVDYDSGSRYVDCLDDIFKYTIETSGFSFFSDTDIEQGIKTYKFGIDKEYKEDNKKVEYFRREEQSDLTISGETAIREVEDFSPEYSGNTIISTGICINPEGESKYLEAAANSIINLKNIKIKFNKPTSDEDALKLWILYLKTVVFKYVEQMLPSTCILRWEIGDEIEPEPVTCNLRVTPSTATIEWDGTTVLTGDCSCSDGSHGSISWSSSNPNVATVNNGVVRANTQNETGGTATITATCNGQTFNVTITVNKKPEAQVTGITLTVNGEPRQIPARGGTVNCDNLTSTVTAKYSDGTERDITSSARINCTPVSAGSKGTTVTGVTTAGTLNITANYESFSDSTGKTVLQEANEIVDKGESTGKTQESTSAWTGDCNTVYQIKVTPTEKTVTSGAGSFDVSVDGSATTECTAYECDTWYVVTTKWSAFTSTESASTTTTGSTMQSGNTRSHQETDSEPTATRVKSGIHRWLTASTTEISYAANTGDSRYDTVTYEVVDSTGTTGTCKVNQEAKGETGREVKFTFDGTGVATFTNNATRYIQSITLTCRTNIVSDWSCQYTYSGDEIAPMNTVHYPSGEGWNKEGAADNESFRVTIPYGTTGEVTFTLEFVCRDREGTGTLIAYTQPPVRISDASDNYFVQLPDVGYSPQ